MSKTEMLPSSDKGDGAEVICACGFCTPDIQHSSDCAVHNPPASPAGACDCAPAAKEGKA